jgi:hypothetical protein
MEYLRAVRCLTCHVERTMIAGLRSLRVQRRANPFDLRYGETVMPEGPGWELCEKVLARRDVIERLSEGW